jgi:hypothetical protein
MIRDVLDDSSNTLAVTTIGMDQAARLAIGGMQWSGRPALSTLRSSPAALSKLCFVFSCWARR